MLDETMSKEPVALSGKFLHRKNRFLTPTLRRLFYNAFYFIILFIALCLQLTKKH